MFTLESSKVRENTTLTLESAETPRDSAKKRKYIFQQFTHSSY